MVNYKRDWRGPVLWREDNMSQFPATPKWKRAALLFAPDRLRRSFDLAPSEQAAFALRKVQGGRVPPRYKHVSFLIPLVSPEQVGDWQAVCERLHETLRCMIAQDDPHWQAVICCQTRPPLPMDERITWLPFDDPTPGNDKWRKLQALVDHLAALSLPPGYVMSFDADDLLRQGTVAQMLGRQAPGGYLVREGYVLNSASGEIALAGAARLKMPLRKPFWKLCGSCAALGFDPSLPEAAAFLRAMLAHEHRMFPYLASLAGLALTPLDQPSVLYVLNHGENFGARRGRVSFKQRFVTRHAITDSQELSELALGFPAPENDEAANGQDF